MRHRRFHAALFLAILTGSMAAAWGCREAPPVLKVGCQGDRAFRRSIEIALASIKASGSPVQVEVVFDESRKWTPVGVIDSTDMFCRDPKIQAVIGFTSSDAALAAARIFNRNSIPQIIPTGTSTKLLDTGPWTFKLCPNDNYQARILADTAWRRLGARHCAVVYQNSDYGRGLSELFRSEFQALGGEIAFAALLGSGFNRQDEVDLHVQQIIAQAPDLLVLICQPQQADMVQQELVRRQSPLPLLGSDSMGTRKTLAERMDVFEGLHILLFYHHQFPFPGNAAFVEKYKTKNGNPPGYEAALAHDALMLLHQAVFEGARSREEIRTFLAELTEDRQPFQGVAGPIIFTPVREVERPLHLGVIRSGFLELARAGEPIPQEDL